MTDVRAMAADPGEATSDSPCRYCLEARRLPVCQGHFAQQFFKRRMSFVNSRSAKYGEFGTHTRQEYKRWEQIVDALF